MMKHMIVEINPVLSYLGVDVISATRSMCELINADQGYGFEL